MTTHWFFCLNYHVDYELLRLQHRLPVEPHWMSICSAPSIIWDPGSKHRPNIVNVRESQQDSALLLTGRTVRKRLASRRAQDLNAKTFQHAEKYRQFQCKFRKKMFTLILALWQNKPLKLFTSLFLKKVYFSSSSNNKFSFSSYFGAVFTSGYERAVHTEALLTIWSIKNPSSAFSFLMMN